MPWHNILPWYVILGKPISLGKSEPIYVVCAQKSSFRFLSDLLFYLL